MSQSPTISPPIPSQLASLAADIKLSHTLFALPFALLATFLAAKGLPTLPQFLLILLCMVTARTLAMSANRLLDADLDAQNPRTKNRALPSGRVSKTTTLYTILACAYTFELACAAFYRLYANPIPMLAGPAVLAFIAAYPLLKRYTSLCHYYLGTALALAPLCAHFAITNEFSWTPFLLGGGVLFWTAGFDILYATQDHASDLATNTFSIPAKLGLTNAFLLARASHLLSLTLLLLTALSSPQLGPLFLSAIALTALLLLTEHLLISPTNLSKLNLSFFTLNACISLTLSTLGILDTLL